MKIGILTFQFAHNYGAMLQCYALKQKLELLGNEVVVINYIPKKMADFYSLNPLIALKRKDIKALLINIIRVKQAKKFKAFQKKYLDITKVVKALNDDFIEENKLDAIIVGSDQVWNYDIVPDLNEYLLSKCHGCKKISYSASLGKKNISNDAMILFKNELPKFKGIAIREKNNAEYLKKELGLNIKHTVDPVFLLKEEDWRKNIINSKYDEIKEKYVLYIDLFNNKKLQNKAIELAKKENLQLFSIDPLCRNVNKQFKNLHNIGPIDYLDLIMNAKYVVTNSFHAVAFSSIFNKKMVYYLKDELSNRITELFLDMNVNFENEIIDFKTYSKESYNNLILKSEVYIKEMLKQ